jgi:hypothetical protein
MAQSINVSLCREVLKLVIDDVRAFNPELPLKEAWVYKLGRDHWEFHFRDFYWYGDADNAFDARAKGWEAFLGKCGMAAA